MTDKPWTVEAVAIRFNREIELGDTMVTMETEIEPGLRLHGFRNPDKFMAFIIRMDDPGFHVHGDLEIWSHHLDKDNQAAGFLYWFLPIKEWKCENGILSGRTTHRKFPPTEWMNEAVRKAVSRLSPDSHGGFCVSALSPPGYEEGFGT